MKRLLPYLLGFFAIAGAFHAVGIWAAPIIATDQVIGRMKKARGLKANVLSVNPPASAARNVVPMGNPDTMVASSWIDLGDGPLVFEAPLPADDRYWSLSIFAHDSDTDFVVSDRDLRGSPRARVVIAREGKEIPAQPEGTQIARISTRQAFLLVRVIMQDRNDPAERAAIAELLQGAKLEPLA